jgi:hypothetical protein
MKLDRLAVATVLVALAGASAACASDPNKEVKTAEANVMSAQHEAKDEEARLAQKQAEEQQAAVQEQKPAEERAELQTKQTEEQIEVRAEGAKEVAEADWELARAQANMQKQRTVFETIAKSRLTKADAQAWDVKNKSGHVPANRRSKFNAAWSSFTAKKSEVQNRLGSLPKVTSPEYAPATQKLERALNDLDASVQALYDNM